jgi:integrase
MTQPVKFVSVAPGIYRGLGGSLFERPWISGVRTWRKLASTTIRAGVRELAKRRADQALNKRGLADNPYAPMRNLTVASLLDFYKGKECPGLNNRPRLGKQLSDDLYRVKMLREFFGPREAPTLSLSDCQAYHFWRIARVRRGAGDRTVDLELTTLSAAFRCALRHSAETGIRANPLGVDRVVFVKSEAVRHARDVQPKDAAELHRLARYFFDTPGSEALGWLLLFQGMTGRRINELHRLRTDGKNETVPGFTDGKLLYFEERRSHKGTNGFIEIHEALADLIPAHREWLGRWHREREESARKERKMFPESPWYFPGRAIGKVEAGQSPIDKAALTRGLARACGLLGLPHRTSHGLRSYYVNVLRSQGVADYEIALRIGQKSGGSMIVEVYGDARPDKLAWLPPGPPAWKMFEATGVAANILAFK